jgi:protein TonB
MFTVVVDRRKRRAWSPGTVAVSVGVHLLVLGALAAPPSNASRPLCPDCEGGLEAPLSEENPSPPEEEKQISPAVEPTALAPAQAQPAPGTEPGVQAPDSVPMRIGSPNAGAAPQPPHPGSEPAGAGPRTPAPTPRPPPGGAGPLPDFRDSIFDPEVVDQLPRFLDPREARRLLVRMYPGTLRDAGITGITVVELVIDRNGEVEPGSVTVEETTHEAFRAAAVRAAQRFRFRPARLRGQPVPVRVSLPIEWTIQP